MSYTNTDMVWRFPIAFQVIFCLIIISGMLVTPESPRWCALDLRAYLLVSPNSKKGCWPATVTRKPPG